MSVEYTTKSGKTQYKPTLEEIEEMEHEDVGFCLACGAMEQAAEPDARRYTCDCCGQPKVYGWAELAMMNLVATAP